MDAPPPTPGDDKDWTWVLERPCPECGYDALAVADEDLAGALTENARHWQDVLDRLGERARERPEPTVWSPLEYACHVRDVHVVMGGRVWLMLHHDDPEFPNWDQDATAEEEAYHAQDVATVRDGLTREAAVVSDLYDTVTGAAWRRSGRRDNGSTFTVASLGRYHLHDVVHHLVDVERA